MYSAYSFYLAQGDDFGKTVRIKVLQEKIQTLHEDR